MRRAVAMMMKTVRSRDVHRREIRQEEEGLVGEATARAQQALWVAALHPRVSIGRGVVEVKIGGGRILPLRMMGRKVALLSMGKEKGVPPPIRVVVVEVRAKDVLLVMVRVQMTMVMITQVREDQKPDTRRSKEEEIKH
jgi:hypothetical protein